MYHCSQLTVAYIRFLAYDFLLVIAILYCDKASSRNLWKTLVFSERQLRAKLTSAEHKVEDSFSFGFCQNNI